MVTFLGDGNVVRSFELTDCGPKELAGKMACLGGMQTFAAVQVFIGVTP